MRLDLFQLESYMKKSKLESIFCEVCNTQTKYTCNNFYGNHVKKFHPEIKNTKEYYDLFKKTNDEGMCLHCGEPTKFGGYIKGYKLFCSKSCYNVSEYKTKAIKESYKHRDLALELEKRNQTNLDRYGTTSYLSTQEGKDKYKATMMKNYGVSHNFLIPSCVDKRNEVFTNNSEEINNKRRDSWTSEKKQVANTKRILTTLNVYGVENVGQNEKIKNKIKNTFQEIYGFDSAFQSQVVKDKITTTLLERYGVTHISRVPSVIASKIKTSQERYGSDYYLGSQKRRELLESSGAWTPRISMNEFLLYSKLVWIVTRKHEMVLFDSWNGRDYYTEEELITNKKEYNSPLYRTIDHKISVRYGFLNGISPEIIGDIDNLCICSRSNNSKKNVMSEFEFKRVLDNVS